MSALYARQRRVEYLLKEVEDDYVYMGHFKYVESKRDVVLVLGSSSFYLIEMGEDEIEDLDELPTGGARGYISLASAEEDLKNPNQFVLFQTSRPAIFLTGEELETAEAVVVLNALIRDAWQKACEENIVLGREIYQFHAVVRKINRKKRTQDRVWVVSNQWIYNLEAFGDSGPEQEFKWSLPIGSLLRVAAGQDDEKLGEFPATIHFDLEVAKGIMKQSAYADHKAGTKGKSINDKHQLLFMSQAERDKCVMALVALYYTQTKKKLAYDHETHSTGLRRSQLGVIKKEGVLNKYTRGAFGIGKHDRFFQIKTNGIISWGKDKAKMKYT